MIHKRLHHIGVIMPSLEEAEAFMKQFGLEVDHKGYVAPYHAHYIFTKMNENESESPLELLIPTEGVLAQYNKGRGGIHHICYEVDDVQAACDEFVSKGYEMLEKEVSQASPTMKINFVRPKYTHGILVEFMEITEPTEDYLK
ncbi:VOC family protein [Marinisporobacter balticus]|uniref:Lactoylglutathione lyase/methylmalonyl-CoA/ethylmalonyl-CoA epimerase n=1 Tax=Marinisporobacter balticus TaxID=2018667 RepID=A0A4V2SBZ6_9FIRM|nr:VOC family protein [Marinisporobacter balticus]TCO77390.1 lactoylglutathione lyase/methylmalonyl-CoA/ethylmalonyl-CoA epimerase [Marinisporobacter balticus]